MIHCIGDSHTGIFNSDNNFIVHYIELATASHIKNHLKIIDDIVSKIKDEDYILFVMGEIDCRVFLETKISYYENIKENVDKNILINKIVNKYFHILNDRYSKYKLIFWGPVASYREDLLSYHESLKNIMPNMTLTEIKKHFHPSPDFFMPGNHSCIERNEISKIFNEELERCCIKHNKIFLTMFYDMIDENLLTKYEMTDGIIHLNETVLPIIRNKFKEKNIF